MGLFSKSPKKPTCPVPEDTRLWMENSFLWLMTQFGEETIININVLTPDQLLFSKENLSETDFLEVAAILSQQMGINISNIEIDFYNDNVIEVGNSFGNSVTTSHESEGFSAGLYLGVNENRKYLVAIERSQLKDTGKAVSVLAHEFAHIKLLGEKRLDTNDEYLTDLTTVFYGLGVFSANSSFKFHKTSTSWSSSKQGYLTQQEWGYALALFSYIKNSTSPPWIDLLSPNVKSDFIKSIEYIYSNKDKILQ